MTTTTLSALKQASDFKVLSETEYSFSFNEHRGGDFTNTVAKTVRAFGAEWEVSLRWIDRSWGDYAYDYSTDATNNFTYLAQKGVTIDGASIEALANLPIDWSILSGMSGITDFYSYYSGSAATVKVCDKYITVDGEYSSNSCVQMQGFIHERPIAQFLLDGTDNTENYVAFCKRKKYNEKFEKLIQEGATKAQAAAYMKAKARWKHENPLKWCFEHIVKQPNRAVWEAIATASGKRHGNAIAVANGVGAWYEDGTFPRNSESARLIAQLCTESYPIRKPRPYPVEGAGWKLINA